MVFVYSDSAGDIVIQLREGHDTAGTIRHSETFTVVSGENILNLNWTLSSGDWTIFMPTGGPSLWRMNSGGSYPHTYGTFSIEGTGSSSSHISPQSNISLTLPCDL